MNCKPGDLVGIPFPYSDLGAEKRRPVLVITQEDRYGDFICAAVTSVPATKYAVLIDNTSMKSGRLPRRSWIRCDKIFTLSKPYRCWRCWLREQKAWPKGATGLPTRF